jgi:hypothetical protein
MGGMTDKASYETYDQDRVQTAMTKDQVKAVWRAPTWPDDAARAGRASFEIKAEIPRRRYEATPDELAGD